MSPRLVDHLPRVLAEDPILCQLLDVFQAMEDGVQDLADEAVELLDPELAPPSMVRYLARWMGIQVDASLPDEDQRRIAAGLSGGLGWVGTQRGTEQMLSLLTGHAARVRDSGGIYPTGMAPGHASKLVWIEMDGAGASTLDGLRTLVARLVPADVAVRIELPGDVLWDVAGSVELPPQVLFLGAPWPSDVGGMPS